MATFTSALKGKCPKCETGAIFAEKGNVLLLRVPKMNERCPHCGYRFEKEPGYFLGAMYVSYGMTVAEMLLIFLATFAFVPIGLFFALILGGMVLLSFFNFRVSRSIWINLFPY